MVGRATLARHQVQPGDGFAVQPVGGPVRRHVGTVTPDRTELLATDGLPHLASGLDVAAREDDAAVRRGDGRGYRWHLAMDLAADPEQDGERGRQQDGEAGPELAGGHGA